MNKIEKMRDLAMLWQAGCGYDGVRLGAMVEALLGEDGAEGDYARDLAADMGWALVHTCTYFWYGRVILANQWGVVLVETSQINDVGPDYVDVVAGAAFASADLIGAPIFIPASSGMPIIPMAARR